MPKNNELAAQKKQKLEELANAFQAKYGEAQMDYYKADVAGRRVMLEDQLLMQMVESSPEPDPNVEELRKKVQGPAAQEMLTAMAQNVHNLEVCNNLFKKEPLQGHVLAKRSDGDNSHMEYIKNELRGISSNEKEREFRKNAPALPGLARQQAENVRRVADELFECISEVDFNLLGLGSDEFKQMKKSVQELRSFAHEKYKPDANQKISPEIHKELLQKTRKALERVGGYLDYKNEQILRDPARRSARQKHEQPRIVRSIEAYDKLTRFFVQQAVTKPGSVAPMTDVESQNAQIALQKLPQNVDKYIKNLASYKSKEAMGRQDLFDRLDKLEAQAEQQKKKPGGPKL